MKTPKLKSPRLLPVVILAVAALLIFKGIGLVTNGGYVLTGVAAATAAETADAGAPSVENAAPRTEPTLSDSSPTLTDTSPTIATKPPDAPAAPAGDAPAADAKPADGAAASAAPATPAPPPAPVPALMGSGCATSPPTPTAGSGAAAPAATTTDVSVASLSANGCADAVPMRVDVNGRKIPLASADGGSLTEDAVLQRLGERRAELDKREADLNTREAIVAAAEKQMQDRADALKALEAQINALSDEKKQAEDQQFSAVVNMYETMKPQEAAPIFDGLDMAVLKRVAKAMNPKKMAPILAKMTPEKAQELTAQLAADDTSFVASTAPSSSDPNALPQIVGH